MRKSWSAIAVLAAGVLVLGGCGSDDSGGAAAGDTTSAASAAPSSSAGSEALLTTEDNAAYGTIVVDGQGMTVYMFDMDVQGSGASTCSGQCLVAWPAVVAESASLQVDGVTGEVGTITRDDGTLQVTLAGWPLYHWQDDAAPGDATGQAVQDVWWVIAPDGTPVRTLPPAA
jgi:predicted lipoprotein with Yx(FWY)xxD motif